MSKLRTLGSNGKASDSKASREGYDFSSSWDVTEIRFNFGLKDSKSVTVDQTLAALFDTLSVECSSVLVHPQWKHFRHIQMLKNDRTRLSNGIWRSWHMQFLKMKTPLYCRFDIDPMLNHHQRQEAIVLEGKYWKRNSDAVANEYRKWRFYKEKSVKKIDPALAKVQEKAAQIFDELTGSQQPQDMQVDPAGPPFPSYGGYLSEEKMLTSYHPYTEYGMMVQQPNLDMLNPMLDDILDKLNDPMAMDTFPLAARPPNAQSSSIFVGGSLNLQSPITSSYTQPNPQAPVLSSPFSPTRPRSRQQQPQAMPLSPVHPTSIAAAGNLQLDGGDPYPFGFMNTFQQQSQQQQSSSVPPPDQVSLMALMQGEGLEGGGRGRQQSGGIPAGGDNVMLDIQAAGNIAMKCEASFEDDLSASQRALQESMYQSPHHYQQQPQQRGDLAGDVRLAASTSGGSSNSSGIGDSVFNVQQQQESSWFSTVLGPKDSIPLQQRPHGQSYQQQQQAQQQAQQHAQQHAQQQAQQRAQQQIQQQRHSLPSMLDSAVSPVISPRPAATGHSTPRMGHDGSLAGRGHAADTFQFATPSPVTSPPSMVMSSAKMRQRRPSPPDFTRAPSADNLYGKSSRPPLERGSSEPVGHLQIKLQTLNAQAMKQTEELDKQKNIADTQYSEMLMQLIQSQGRSKPSEEQQKVLQMILSDSSILGMLKTALLTNQSTVTTGSSQIQQDVRHPPSSPATPAPVTSLPSDKHVETATSSFQHEAAASLPPYSCEDVFNSEAQSNLMLTSQLSKISEVNDFQKGLLMAAITQANSVQVLGSGSTPTTPGTSAPSTPSQATRLSLDELKSPPSQVAASEELSPTQTILKKFKNARHLSSSEKEVYKEIRRQSHISAEQKRRGSIKSGFDQLQSLVINPNAFPSGKVSKATILEKTLEHIKTAHSERSHRDAEIAALKARIEELNAAIVVCQEKLPVSGAPVTRQRFEENRQRFRSYVQKRTLQNYKFWIFSIILRQLFESYNSMVSIGTVDELCRTVLAWFEQNCALPALRPVVMNSLKELSQQTSILSDPSQVPRQLTQYAQQQSSQEPDLGSGQPGPLNSQDNLDLIFS